MNLIYSNKEIVYLQKHTKVNIFFYQLSFRSSVVLIKCHFDQMSFRLSVVRSTVVAPKKTLKIFIYMVQECPNLRPTAHSNFVVIFS